MARHNLRRASGREIAAVATVIQVCDACGVHHERNPPQCYCGGMAFTRFDSKGEATRWAQLLLLEKAGEISELRRQVTYNLHAPGQYYDGAIRQELVGKFIPDFVYTEKGGEVVVEDYKGGAITELAEWKLRHFKAQYGFDVRIVTAKML